MLKTKERKITILLEQARRSLFSDVCHTDTPSFSTRLFKSPMSAMILSSPPSCCTWRAMRRRSVVRHQINASRCKVRLRRSHSRTGTSCGWWGSKSPIGSDWGAERLSCQGWCVAIGGSYPRWYVCYSATHEAQPKGPASLLLRMSRLKSWWGQGSATYDGLQEQQKMFGAQRKGRSFSLKWKC